MESKLPDKAQELLQSIRPDMRLTKDFFKRVYGWEMDYPGVADRAVNALEAAGCSRAREYYDTWVQEYEAERDAVLKRVSVWYGAELKRRRAEKERQVRKERKEQEIELLEKKKRLLMQKSRLLTGS